MIDLRGNMCAHRRSNGLGSTMALTDADGDVVNTYDYDVFGDIRSSTGSQPNEFRFTGEQWDDSTESEYLRARYYDPGTGRFFSQDPLALAGWSGHAFGYADNNPVSSVDPLGLQTSPGDMTDAEREWCTANPLHPAGCYRASDLGIEAIWMTDEVFPGQPNQDNAADAFRHCYLGGLLTITFGPDEARGFIDRHEDAPGNLRPRKWMDIHNSYCGVLLGEKFNNWYFGWPEDVQQEVQRLALQYTCYIGTWNGVLITSLFDRRVW
jgi:RHS repeat-associated protein